MKKILPAPGNEFRGIRIRLYPTKDQESWLLDQSDKLRIAWNWLVSLGYTEKLANVSYLSKLMDNGDKVLRPKPSRPSYDGLLPEAAHDLAEKYHSECSLWYKSLELLRKKESVCTYRNFYKDVLPAFDCKWDYQLLQRVIWWRLYPDKEDLSFKEAKKNLPNAHLLQAMCKDFFGKGNKQRPKKFRKTHELMPVRTRSGECLKIGSFGKRGNNTAFYNCQITISNQKIRGRLPVKSINGRILEGVALVKEADGWYAAVKAELPIRNLTTPIPGSCIGIDVGLDNIAGMSDGRLIVNTRTNYFSEKIARLQQNYEDTQDNTHLNQVSRLHQKAKRHLMHLLYNEIVKPLAEIETIKIEKLTSRIGFMSGSRKISTMRLVTNLVKERYKDRVREVRCEYTSQRCSHCGKCDKRTAEAWSYSNGPFGTCPYCKYHQHRDINAGRNIRDSDVLPLDN
jgi:putative transposase